MLLFIKHNTEKTYSKIDSWAAAISFVYKNMGPEEEAYLSKMTDKYAARLTKKRY